MSSTAQPSPPGQAPSQMRGMLNGFLIVQALHVAAVLGIADLLASGSQSVPDLTAATGPVTEPHGTGDKPDETIILFGRGRTRLQALDGG